MTSLQTQAFHRCYALRKVIAPGCKQFGAQVFEECCALLQIGTTHDATNQLTPQAELMTRAFRKCTVLRQINFELTEHQPNGRTRYLPECCFMEAGLTALTLPPEFNWMGPSVCERCTQLQLVDLSRTGITEVMGGTFAHCKHLQTLKLPGVLRIIRQEAFLKCASLTEVHVPPTFWGGPLWRGRFLLGFLDPKLVSRKITFFDPLKEQKVWKTCEG